MRRISSFAVVVALIIIASASVAAAQDGNAKDITFTVSMPKPHTHLFEVAVRIVNVSTLIPGQETLVMPVWQPGSYLIREFERHVQDFAATDMAGRSLAWEKINKNSWRITTAGAREWRATYRVYANELSVRTSELNSDHAFWNNAALLMYADCSVVAPSISRVKQTLGWMIAT